MSAIRLCIAVLAICPVSAGAEDVPDYVSRFRQAYCVECHGPQGAKGDFRIDSLAWSLIDGETRQKWDLVRDYVADGDMPPQTASKHPDAAVVKGFVARLEADFARADQISKPGGTPIRRLNRVEYLNTVRDLFGIRMINLPASFPDDASNTEFDTMPAGLFLSPAVMEAYHDVATDIADRIVPLSSQKTYKSRMSVSEIGGDANRRWFDAKKEFLKFIGLNHSGWAGALWDPLFVAPESGVYRVHLLANAQAETGADNKPLRVAFYAFDPTTEQLPKRYLRHRAAQVGQTNVPTGEPAWIQCDLQMEAGETFHVYCENRFAPGTYPELPTNRAQVNKDVTSAKQRTEPTIELREMKVEGPVGVLARVKDYFGDYPPKLSRKELQRRLLPLAARAYRRPLTDLEQQQLLSSVLAHGQQTRKPEIAWHYAIRRILCSPAFLYREAETETEPPALAAGPSPTVNNTRRPNQNRWHWASAFGSQGSHLSSHALASRLSYTIWSTMPDAELLRLADRDQLSKPDVLKAQLRRLLDDPKSHQFVKHFTGQWLGNRIVASINVCDNRYEWDDNVRYGFVRSTEMFFDEVLRKNLPITTFIDSDFTYANSAMRYTWGFRGNGQKNLGAIAADQRQSLIWPEPERISLSDLPKEAPVHLKDRGGILGLPGVLTVTGDGVESSPILRGVWVLENMFGHAPPPPPMDVPALDVDTSQATSVREILAAHKKLESCASCHRDIDPLGLALENYDAVGGWRTKYVGSHTEIDARAVMPSGVKLAGPLSIKAHLLEHRELFTRCLLTKLLEFGAGRQLSIGDRRIVNELVAAEPAEGYRFGDLIEAALCSEVFVTK